MIHIKKFEKNSDKEKSQEMSFKADSLVDKDAKPGFKTEVEDNEKVQKEFKKQLDKIEKFETFINVHIDNIENIENHWDVEHEVEQSDDDDDENDFDAEYEEEEGCGCCDNCNGQPGCDCGCEDCKCGEMEIEVIPASQVIGGQISENLKYHLDNNMPVTESIFRPGSREFFSVIKEARLHFDLGEIKLADIDKELFESSDIGRFVKFNGETVPLDLPMK